MKWLTFEISRAPGFRFNLIDLGLILLAAGCSLALFQVAPESSAGWMPLYVTGSFFLFCNVFRIGNRLEIFWYLPFSFVAAYCFYTWSIEIFWWSVLLLFEPLKCSLIAWRIYKGPYYGVCHRRLNHIFMRSN